MAAFARLPKSFGAIRDVAQAHLETRTIGQLLRTSQPGGSSRLEAARWLKGQLPIRFARRIEEMLKLPHMVVSNPQINRVLGAHVDTFEDLHGFPAIETREHEEAFAQLIRSNLARHSANARDIAEGYRDVRRLYPEIHLDGFLRDHFTIRIATRIFMDSYLAMRAPQPEYVGVVLQGMRPLDILEETVGDIKNLAHALYGFSPAVEYRGNLGCILDYIPRHIKYMARELLKNAFRSTCERHQSRSDSSSNLQADVPPVVVELQEGDRHVIIKISDQGGGIPKHVEQDVWQYGWSTVKSNNEHQEAWQYADEVCAWDQLRPGSADCSTHRAELTHELAGYGFGLPLTRLHAQYFGGDVLMQVLPGHGIDMYIILTHLTEGTPYTEVDDLSMAVHAKEGLNRLVREPGTLVE